MLRVSNTNGNKCHKSVVRMYKDDVKIVEVFINKRNPLNYLKTLNSSRHLVELHKQLVAAMQDDVISLEDAQELTKDLNINF